MIKIQWIVTSDLSNITLEEFDTEWNGMVFGYFALIINGRMEGLWPNSVKELEEKSMIDMEDILYWLYQLKEGGRKIKEEGVYEMALLTMNKYKLVMKLTSKLKIAFIDKKTSQKKWDEEVELEQFENELYINIKEFLDYIRKANSELLKSKWVKKLLGDKI